MSKIKLTKNCANCRYFEPGGFGKKEGLRVGACLYRPPVKDVWQSNTYGHRTCSKFKKAKKASDAVEEMKAMAGEARDAADEALSTAQSGGHG